MKAMILAAGLGTRLRPVTYTLPKPMVPLCNEPLIGWIAASLVDAGITDLIVNLHHLPEAIESYLPKAFPEAQFHFSFEPEILGTGGGLRKVRTLLEQEEDFFLVNGDTVQLAPFARLREARQRGGALAALALRHPPAGDYFTPVWCDGERITGFGEGTGEALMFSGAHCISARVFDVLPDSDVSSIVDDVYKPRLATDKLAGVVDDGVVWFDIGTPMRYMTASRSMLDLMRRGDVAPRAGSRIDGDSLVHHSAKAHGANSIVGARTVVEGKVRDSVIWNDCFVGPRVSLDGCIVAHGVQLKGEVSYSSALICKQESDLVIVSI